MLVAQLEAWGDDLVLTILLEEEILSEEGIPLDVGSMGLRALIWPEGASVAADGAQYA